MYPWVKPTDVAAHIPCAHIHFVVPLYIFFFFPLHFEGQRHFRSHITLPEHWAHRQGRFSVMGIRWLHNAWHIKHRGAPCWLLDTHLANLTSLSQFILLFHFPSPWFHLFPYLSLHFLLFLPLHLRLIYCLFQPQNVSFQMTVGLYNTALKAVTLI